MSRPQAFQALTVLRSIRDARGLVVGDKMILVAVTLRFNPREGEARPSQTLLAADTGIPERTLRRRLVALEARGLLEVTRGRQHFCTRYRVSVDALGALGKSPETGPSTATPEGHAQTGHVGHPGSEPRPATLATLRKSRPAKTARQGGQNCTPDRPSFGRRSAKELPRELPRSRRPRPSVSKKAAHPGHPKVIAAFSDAYLDAKGGRPLIGAREGKAANTLLDRVSVDEAVQIIRNAFADPFIREKKPELVYIAANVNSYRSPFPTGDADAPSEWKRDPMPLDVVAFDAAPLFASLATSKNVNKQPPLVRVARNGTTGEPHGHE